ncbi:unnamed protein product [Sphagnum jensenii]|uniref:Uncharacterized protein n=1 Tax=Sphagnum jensenii TaxID=128206 RepID=A0ABP0VDK4_9BRYO
MSAGAGLVQYTRAFRSLVEAQLKLDSCVAQMSRKLKVTCLELDRLNEEVEGIRVAIAEAGRDPLKSSGIPRMQEGLTAVVAKQDTRLGVQWPSEVRNWNLGKVCDLKSAQVGQLPLNLPVFRPPPDLLGPQPLHWKVQFGKGVAVYAKRGSRVASAEVVRDQKSGWQNQWRAPIGF